MSTYMKGRLGLWKSKSPLVIFLRKWECVVRDKRVAQRKGVGKGEKREMRKKCMYVYVNKQRKEKGEMEIEKAKMRYICIGIVFFFLQKRDNYSASTGERRNEGLPK